MVWYLIYVAIVVSAWLVDLFLAGVGWFRRYPLESYLLILFGEGALVFELALDPGFRPLAFVLIGLLAAGPFLWESLVRAPYRSLPELPVTVGDPLPEVPAFEWPEGPFVLIYLRALRCPFAAAQRALVDSRAEAFEELGYRVVLATREPEEAMAKLAEQLEHDFELRADPEGALARALGLLPPGDRTGPAPLALVADEQGRIRWIERATSYRTPPHPFEILGVCEELAEA